MDIARFLRTPPSVVSSPLPMALLLARLSAADKSLVEPIA
jgi:hypothetical protein